MSTLVLDVILFAVGVSLGVVLATYLFERKRREVLDLIDVSLETVGIKRPELELVKARLERLESASPRLEQASK